MYVAFLEWLNASTDACRHRCSADISDFQRKTGEQSSEFNHGLKVELDR